MYKHNLYLSLEFVVFGDQANDRARRVVEVKDGRV